MKLTSGTIALAIVFSCNHATCQPFVPADDAQILQTLPATTTLFKSERLITSANLAAVKPDLQHTVTIAKDLINQGRQNADPRAISYAKALLAPWATAPDAPIDILLLQAAIEDHQHNFKGALALYAAVLKKEPVNLQALISTASVYSVLGELDKSRETCAKTLSSSTMLLAAACAAAPGSLQGNGRKVYDAFETIVSSDIKNQGAVETEINWAAGILAEIAERLGLEDRAEKWFSIALKGSPDDTYLLGAYSDFLLDKKDFKRVLTLLANHRSADSLLLRLGIAESGAGSPELSTTIKDLTDRFDSERTRQDSIHRREEARFQLEIKRDFHSALDLAKENWELQKEPIDLLLLASAAVQTNDADALRTVAHWRKRWPWEDVRLDRILATTPGKYGDIRNE